MDQIGKVLMEVVKLSLLQNNHPYNYFLQAKEKLRPYWKCLASAITEDVIANTISAPRTAEPQVRFLPLSG